VSAFSVVVPTVGRASLGTLLDSLAACAGPRPARVVVVDDSPDGSVRVPGVAVLRSGGRGPAAARNVGWRACDTDWVVFVDDDVQVDRTWLADLADDLDVPAEVAGVQGRITVPLPKHRRPTDWERGTAGLATAKWITADIAYRRAVLAEVGGFDERFPRAFREDADLALRVQAAGHRLVLGRRHVVHPVRNAPWWASIAQQRGNADDALMRAVHGPDWYARAGADPGRRSRHLAITALGLLGLAGAVARRPVLARAGLLGWVAGTAEFAAARIAPGPRDVAEVARMLATSVAIPPLASGHWLRGRWRWRTVRPARAVDAVLLDRDGTLVHDVPYNGEPDRVEPVPGARAALDRLRAAGIRVGVITNQSGVARGVVTLPQVAAVNRRVDELLGPFADWQVCPHGPDDGCECRKPRPGMVRAAAHALGVDVRRCVVIGDTGADVAAAEAAGAVGVLVPNAVTRREEVAAASRVFAGLAEVVDAVLAGGGR
jgi:histidinol-phosphate phosphatase family protein